MNGGNVGGVTTDIEDDEAVIGSYILSASTLPEPVRTGYTLLGWGFDDAGAVMVSATDKLVEADTIYSIWEQD